MPLQAAQRIEKSNLALLPNVQFLYELHLASLEIESLCPGAEVLPDFRSFSVGSNSKTEDILRHSAYIGSVDGVTSAYAQLTQYNLTRAFNQYITHWFYPYKGKFHPQMVRALANIIGLKEGDSLLDPFVGSGTTAVEGALMNLQVIGFDISPLCVLIAKVKANALHHLPKIKKSYLKASLFQEQAADYKIRNELRNPAKSFELLAKMIATSDSARRKRNFDKMLAQNREKMIQSIQLMEDGCKETGISPTPADIKIGDARRLPLPDNSVDGIITSPPYSLALNYVENDSHSLESLGYDLKKIREDFIGVRGVGGEKIELYEQDMEQAYEEMARVLKPLGKAVIVIGDATVNGNKVRTSEKCIGTFENLGFRLLHNVDKLIYGLYNVMQRESILVFERN